MIGCVEVTVQEVLANVVYLKSTSRYSFIKRSFRFTNINKPTKDTLYSVYNIRRLAVKIFPSFGTEGLYSKNAGKESPCKLYTTCYVFLSC